MTFGNPWFIVVAVLVAGGLGVGYWSLQRQRARTLAAAGLTTGRAIRRHIPPVMFLVALALLLLSVARPEATLPVARAAGTVVLAFDVSNSMAADDVAPTRIAAAQTAAVSFVEAQPDSVNIGIVAFDQGALTTQQPTSDRAATTAAIKRLQVNGGTSLGQAILASLTVIVGKPVGLPDPDSTEPPAELGYYGNATIVLLSDGEDTGGPDALAAAQLAATAGVHIETVGVGTVEGTTVEVDGYRVATALNEELLTTVAQTTTGSYHRAETAESLRDVYDSLDLRLTTERKPVELTGAAAAIALLLLTIGGLLMTTWFGRIL
ncbi:VWA domain-containing protein [Dactylosporangium sp. AC04546]|uniref:VWA domain-containing protein n=1 Tax=Dactylosporangium sp. AC04546 TaxID=2862460 RepID=UPI001EDED7AE|nr:VWA domain-containing protein [Dactylosporangium sp. AC04546]WVK81560.1 VWA domain-containing protein [Dactylosporangium sp. AC04546]